jgi:hypothetical protein
VATDLAQGPRAQGHADGGGPVARWVPAKREEPPVIHTLDPLAVESHGGHLYRMRGQVD